MTASLSRRPEDSPAAPSNGPRVLLMQADPAQRALTEQALGDAGWSPRRLGRRPTDRLEGWPPHDLLILDPQGLDPHHPAALDWTPLRDHATVAPGVPVIVLLADDPVADAATHRVLALEMGADAVVAWPCHPRELVLRAGAALRHALARPRAAGRGASPAVRPLGALGGAWLDLATRRLHGGTTSGVQLSLAEWRLLCAFLEQPGRVLGRNDLLALARGTGVDQLDRSVDLLVSRLRRKLAAGGDGAAHIRTVRGAGYCYEPGREAPRATNVSTAQPN